MPDRIFLSSPDVGPLEESFLVDAVRSGWIAPLGPHVDAFEREMSARLGVPHAVALSSGTAALHLALLELGARPGTVVVVPTLTFVATANAVMYTGAEPVFVDCDPATGNLSPELLRESLLTLRAQGAQVACVISVDLFGKAADYQALQAICEEHDIWLLEDAAEALGATDRGAAAGSFGQAAVLSFNGNKIMTTSGGGMLLSHDGELANRVRHLSTQARLPVDHYEHEEVGYNYRLSNLLAALGRAQLARLDEMVAVRRVMRELYKDAFSQVPGVNVLGGGHDEHDNCWLTVVTVDPKRSGWQASELAKHLSADAVETRPVWKPMHQQPVFRGARTFLDGSADRLFDLGLALPSGSVLGDAQRQRIRQLVSGFLQART